MAKRVLVLSAGIGNVASVCKALERAGATPVLSDKASEIAGADRLVFPGQGAFSVMNSLREKRLDEALLAFISSSRPYLGICLGMQMLFEDGDECPGVPGLGVLDGRVGRLPARAGKIPHIGWNDVKIAKADPLLQGVTEGTDFYFAHSYAVTPVDSSMVTLTCDYGGPFAAAIRHNNLFACQFHPEKSQSAGLTLLGNFIAA